MLLSEPKNSAIVKSSVELVDVKQVSHNMQSNKYVYEIELSSAAVTPFVCIDFKPNSQIKGQFPDNGFFMFNSHKTIRFQTNSNITVQQIKDNITFKTLTDVV